MSKEELEVLVEQLDELLTEGASDAEDALEIAIVAGLVARLDGDMTAADAWRRGPGGPLLTEGWQALELSDALEALDAVAGGSASEEEIEEALFEVDEWVAAAIWCGQRDVVKELAKQAAATIRMVPDVFAPVSDIGSEMSRHKAVAFELGLYDFWLAVADAAQWAENN